MPLYDDFGCYEGPTDDEMREMDDYYADGNWHLSQDMTPDDVAREDAEQATRNAQRLAAREAAEAEVLSGSFLIDRDLPF